MVEARSKLEPEVQKIFEHIDLGANFLLSGGAGSGKTYSLVQVIKQVLEESPTAQIACITYTNAAVKEISERFSSKNLSVSTIHDFLWDNIKSFQKELKKALIDLINNPDVEEIKSSEGEISNDYFLEKEIQYKEYLLISEGIISHDELLIIASYLFKIYPKLSDILKDKFKFIFIDEYQDTSPLVIEIMLKYLKSSSKNNIIGFFGDSMQSIYEDGIGNLNEYIASNDVKVIPKKQNRRNPRVVYELANRLRTDNIQQEPSNDNNAPNMKDGVIKEGNIKFYYSTGEEQLNILKQTLGWDFSDSKETKILNLTHNLIAPKAGFEQLMKIYDGDKILDYRNRIKKYIKDNNIIEDFSTLTFGQVIEKLLEGKTTQAQQKPIQPTDGMKKFIDENPSLYEIAKRYPFEEFKKIYVDKEALLDDKKENEDEESKKGSKRDNLIKHLFKIQTNVSLYTEGKFNEFLRRTEFQIKSIADKVRLKERIVQLQSMSNNTIEEIIEYSHAEGICKKDDKLQGLIEQKKYIYDQVKALPFKQFQNLFDYLEGYTPFSTQHKIKGREFNNVLVILDNGNWSSYNFQYLFENNGKDSVRERTQKLFYVCCTRSKENLAVYYHQPTETVINKAREWFGENNIQAV